MPNESYAQVIFGPIPIIGRRDRARPAVSVLVWGAQKGHLPSGA